MFNLLSNYAIDKFLPIAKWLVIGFILVLLISWLIVALARREKFSTFAKKTLIALFVILLAIGLTCLVLEIIKSYSVSYADDNWLNREGLITHVLIPLTVLVVSLLASATALFVISKKANPETKQLTFRKTFIVLGIINLIILVASGVLMAIFYDMQYKNDGYYNSDTASVNQPVLYISVVLLIVVILALGFILNRNEKPIDTHCIALAGITVAMSFGLSYIKLFELPQGGAVTLFSLLPIMIFSYVYGTKKGVFVCLIYGILQAIQDPWIIHPAQFLLDYPIAFSAIGLSGMLAKTKAFEKIPQIAFLLGGIIASVLRFTSHVFSGVFAFEAYAEGVNSWIYSLGYNSFVFVDIAIVLGIGLIVFSSKAFMKEIEKLSNK